MKTIGVALSLVLSLAASALAAGDEFTADKSSPLKLARPAGGEVTIVHFTGTVRISGRFLAAWEGFDRKPRYLRVTFWPEGATSALLPHATNTGAVKELMLTNNEQAATEMSGLGQSRHFGPTPAASGLSRRTDIRGAARHVSKVPTTDIAPSFDHLVGAGELGRRHG